MSSRASAAAFCVCEERCKLEPLCRLVPSGASPAGLGALHCRSAICAHQVLWKLVPARERKMTPSIRPANRVNVTIASAAKVKVFAPFAPPLASLASPRLITRRLGERAHQSAPAPPDRPDGRRLADPADSLTCAPFICGRAPSPLVSCHRMSDLPTRK